MQVKAIVATSPTEPMRVGMIERRALTDHDVLIEIEYAGICHSDIHTVRSEWGPAPYPFVTGHEIAGVVREVGPKVTKHRVGDRVGIGCMVDSCRTCASCQAGDEQFCENGSTMTYAGVDKYGQVTNGGYSTHIVAEEDFVLRIPDAISSQEAAPLLCAGITLFSPLKRWGAGPGKKVAIVGMGGLGHMGVKIAAAMGADVTVLSQTLRKAEDAQRYGATRCFATSDESTFDQLKGQFDLIINTVSAPLDFSAYLKLLKVGGAMVVVGLPEKPIEMHLAPLVLGRRVLAGSLIGGIAETQEMLDFCGQHGLGAEVEVISAGDVNDAYDRVVRSDVRYRFVIDASTIANAPVDAAAQQHGAPVGASR